MQFVIRASSTPRIRQCQRTRIRCCILYIWWYLNGLFRTAKKTWFVECDSIGDLRWRWTASLHFATMYTSMQAQSPIAWSGCYSKFCVIIIYKCKTPNDLMSGIPDVIKTVHDNHGWTCWWNGKSKGHWPWIFFSSKL